MTRRIDAVDDVARVLAQISPQRKHLVPCHGFYSNAARGKRRRPTADANPYCLRKRMPYAI